MIPDGMTPNAHWSGDKFLLCRSKMPLTRFTCRLLWQLILRQQRPWTIRVLWCTRSLMFRIQAWKFRTKERSIAGIPVQAAFAERTRYLRGLQAPTHVHAESPNLTAHQLLSETQYTLEARNLNAVLRSTLHQAYHASHPSPHYLPTVKS